MRNKAIHKRTAIYIRTSSERQAQKVSPGEQEKDCRAYCKERGYTVVKVYRDIERYRVGKKLVEPSGTRSDRPGLCQMLKDGSAGLFDVIVGWREDRLYRGLRPMLDVIDCIEAHDLDIELVKETFDRKIAPVKAWAARMELDAKQERTEMGMKARLAQGKPLNFAVRYGYALKDGKVEINEDEAQWVRKHWKWFGDGVSWFEIRKRLIAGNAPQRRQVKIPWQFKCSWNILHAECYYTGSQVIEWGGETFRMPVPILVDAETARRVAKQRERNKAHPTHHLKYDYLGLDVVYCASCKKKMRSVTYLRWIRSDGHELPGGCYICSNYVREYKLDKCSRKVGAKGLDAKLWEKVWAVLSNDTLFEDGIAAKVDMLRQAEVNAGAEIERLQKELKRLAQERQWVITKGRKQLISDDEIETQLVELNGEETQLKREMAEKSLLIGNQADQLIEFVNGYRRRIAKGAEWLNREPRSKAEAQKQFVFRREIVQAIVKRIDVYPDKSIKVHFEFDASEDTQAKAQIVGTRP